MFRIHDTFVKLTTKQTVVFKSKHGKRETETERQTETEKQTETKRKREGEGGRNGSICKCPENAVLRTSIGLASPLELDGKNVGKFVYGEFLVSLGHLLAAERKTPAKQSTQQIHHLFKY